MQVQKQIDELLALRASEWLEQLSTASAEQLRAFEAWLGESRRHVQEFLEIAEVEYGLHRLDPQRRLDVDALLAGMQPATMNPPLRRMARPFVQSIRPRRRLIRMAAAFAVCALTAVLLYARLGGGERYATEIGEQRVVELGDRSVVTLNADSEIAVRLGDSERRIELLRGAAIFKVADDASRPFRVYTRTGLVQAVGTQFNVHDRYNGVTRVSVLEGRVRLETKSGNRILDAGEEADVHPDSNIELNENADVANSIAWRHGRLVFESAPLEELVAEFNRHNRSLRLRLENLEGDQRRYDGAFEATNPEVLAQLLSREPDLTVERRAGEIVIRR